MIAHRLYKLEACVVSLSQAIQAEERGADRVEICSRLETEGMTPDIDLVSALCNQLTIPVRVMIRATEVGFESNESILKEMIQSIFQLKKFPIDGFVFGVLKNNQLDRDAMQLLLQAASPYPVTIHKAIDLSENINDDIHWINQFPQIDTILTSGSAVAAKDGIAQLLKMKSLFKGNIMAAGKITPQDLPVLHEQLQLNWYHGRAIV